MAVWESSSSASNGGEEGIGNSTTAIANSSSDSISSGAMSVDGIHNGIGCADDTSLESASNLPGSVLHQLSSKNDSNLLEPGSLSNAPAATVSDEAIRSSVFELVHSAVGADEELFARKIRHTLEKNFGCDLKTRKSLILTAIQDTLMVLELA